MDQTGHTDPKFTLGVYAHAMRRNQASKNRLKALVGETAPESSVTISDTNGVSERAAQVIEDDSGSVETADWQAVREMEPAGIEPATSCLQSPSGSGRLRVGCGSRPETLPIPDAAAGLAGSNPGGRGVHQASSQQRRAETRKQPEEDVLHLWVATHYPA